MHFHFLYKNPVGATLKAAQCPPLQVAASSIYRNSGMETTAAVAPNVPANVNFRKQVNQIAAVVDQMARYGTGVYGIPDGPTKITLTAPSSGLLLQVSAGHAMIGGPVELPTASTIAVPDNTNRVWIWLQQLGSALTHKSDLTVPAGECVLIGSCVTLNGNIIAVDYSGVLYLRGGIGYRETSDWGAPGDTPPPSLQLITKTPFSSYTWDSSGHRQQHIPNVPADPDTPGLQDHWYRTDTQTLVIAGGSAPVIPAGVARSVVMTLCDAFTPGSTGADIGERTVPYSPVDGTTSIAWTIRRVDMRVNVAGGAPAITVEKSVGSGVFNAVSVGTLTLGSGAYEGSQTSSLGTVNSGDKLRFNVGALGTATGWTIEVLLGAT